MEREEKAVVLYGAAPQNIRLSFEFLESVGIGVRYIVDKDPKKQGNKIYGVEVISPERLAEFDEKAEEAYDLLITVRTRSTIAEIKQELASLSNAKIYTMNEYNLRYELNRSVKSISQLAIHLTDHCNLNCVRCCHFSSLMKGEFFIPKEDFERDLRRLHDLLGDGIPELMLTGGEPTLHPECDNIFTIAREAFPKARLVLLTNGTLLTKQPDSFFDSCRKNEVLINVTIYDVGIDYEELKRFLASKNVSYIIGDEGDYLRQEPKRMEKVFTLYPDGVCNGKRIDGQTSFLSCYTGKLISLRQGILYFCPTAAYVDLFNRYFGKNLPELKENGIDIYSVDSGKELISSLMKKTALCDFCIPETESNGIPWRTSRREITEWIHEDSR